MSFLIKGLILAPVYTAGLFPPVIKGLILLVGTVGLFPLVINGLILALVDNVGVLPLVTEGRISTPVDTVGLFPLVIKGLILLGRRGHGGSVTIGDQGSDMSNGRYCRPVVTNGGSMGRYFCSVYYAGTTA